MKTPKKVTQSELQKQKPDGEWFESRLAVSNYTARSISYKLSANNMHLWRRTIHEGRECTIAEAIALAPLLGVDFREIVRRLGFTIPEAVTPIIGRVGPHGRISMLPGSAGSCPTPPGMQPAAVALRIDAPQSPGLAIFHGNYLFYEPSRVVRPDTFGRLSVIELSDHAAPVVGVLDRASVGFARVAIFGGAETLDNERVSSATPVLWIKAG